MAIVKMEIPQCDVCGGLWIPAKRLPNGKHNPAYDDPSLCKRCSKCKTPRWNENARKANRNSES